MLEQQAEKLDVPVVNGKRQEPLAVAESRIGVGAAFQEQFNGGIDIQLAGNLWWNTEPSSSRCQIIVRAQQFRHRVVPFIWVSFVIQKQLQDFRASDAEQRSKSLVIHEVRV